MLTNLDIKLAKPRDAAYVLWDDTLRGFGCRVFPSGKRSFIVQCRQRGSRRTIRHTIGPYGVVTIRQARDKAQRLLSDARVGDDPLAPIKALKRADIERANRFTVTMLVDRYRAALYAGAATAYRREDGKLTPGYMRDVERNLGHFITSYGKRDADSITRGEVQALIDSWVHSPATARRLHFMVRRMYTWALERDLVPSNPAMFAKSIPNIVRKNWLPLDKLARIWQAAEALNPLYRDVAQMLILTGQRRGEVGGMEWGEIDLVKALWTIRAPRMKMRREHTIPLPPLALDILHRRRSAFRSRPPLAEDWVFASLSRDHQRVIPVMGWQRIKDQISIRTQISDWNMHDFRRSLVTICANAGGNEDVLDFMLSHSRTGVKSIYQHAKLIEPMREEMTRWNHLLTTAISPAPTTATAKVVQLRA